MTVRAAAIMATILKRWPCGKVIPIATAMTGAWVHVYSAVCLPGKCLHCSVLQPSTPHVQATPCTRAPLVVVFAE